MDPLAMTATALPPAAPPCARARPPATGATPGHGLADGTPSAKRRQRRQRRQRAAAERRQRQRAGRRHGAAAACAPWQRQPVAHGGWRERSARVPGRRLRAWTSAATHSTTSATSEPGAGPCSAGSQGRPGEMQLPYCGAVRLELLRSAHHTLPPGLHPTPPPSQNLHCAHQSGTSSCAAATSCASASAAATRTRWLVRAPARTPALACLRCLCRRYLCLADCAKRFHCCLPVQSFDPGKHSCRKQLEKHNARRAQAPARSRPAAPPPPRRRPARRPHAAAKRNRSREGGVTEAAEGQTPVCLEVACVAAAPRRCLEIPMPLRSLSKRRLQQWQRRRQPRRRSPPTAARRQPAASTASASGSAAATALPTGRSRLVAPAPAGLAALGHARPDSPLLPLLDFDLDLDLKPTAFEDLFDGQQQQQPGVRGGGGFGGSAPSQCQQACDGELADDLEVWLNKNLAEDDMAQQVQQAQQAGWPTVAAPPPPPPARLAGATAVRASLQLAQGVLQHELLPLDPLAPFRQQRPPAVPASQAPVLGMPVMLQPTVLQQVAGPLRPPLAQLPAAAGTGTPTLTTVSVKLFGCTPAELPTGLREHLRSARDLRPSLCCTSVGRMEGAAACASLAQACCRAARRPLLALLHCCCRCCRGWFEGAVHSLEGYLRPGCVHLSVQALLSDYAGGAAGACGQPAAGAARAAAAGAAAARLLQAQRRCRRAGSSSGRARSSACRAGGLLWAQAGGRGARRASWAAWQRGAAVVERMLSSGVALWQSKTMLVQTGGHVALVHRGRLRQARAAAAAGLLGALTWPDLPTHACASAAGAGTDLCSPHTPLPPAPQTWDIEGAPSGRAVPALLDVSPPLLLASQPTQLRVSGLNMLQNDCQLLLRLQGSYVQPAWAMCGDCGCQASVHPGSSAATASPGRRGRHLCHL